MAVQHPSPSSQSVIPVHHDWESIPVVPTASSARADLHSLYRSPWTPTLAQPPCKAPKALQALCTGKGLQFPAGTVIGAEEPAAFWHFAGNQRLFQSKRRESFS